MMSKLTICIFILLGASLLQALDQKENCVIGNAWDIPLRWKSRPLGENDFYIMTWASTHNRILQTVNGTIPFGEEAFVKEGIYNVSPIKTENEYYQKLIKVNNPIIVNCGTRPDTDSLSFMKKHFGKRFLGVYHGEWFSNYYMYYKNKAAGQKNEEDSFLKYKITAPRNKDEAYHLFELDYMYYFGKFQKAGIPVYPFCATFLNHWECRMGASITGEEIGGDERCTPMQLSFSRGASRQYDVPWGTYIASYGGGIIADAETRYQSFIRPDERRLAPSCGGYLADFGPYSGTSLSLQKRFLYLSYMAGANILRKERDEQIFFANYDESTVERINPRVLALQDIKTYLSPLGLVYKEFYDNIVKKHERGIPYTPIALLFDKNHGCILEYSQNSIVCQVPYQKGDYQTRAIINTIFPWENKRQQTGTFESNTNVTGPFGDIFDVLTSDASDDVLTSYKVICLAGNIQLDEKLEQALKKFVENGGILFLTAEQMSPALWQLAGIEYAGEKCKDQVGVSCRSDRYRIRENKEFPYRKVTLKDAVPLVTALKTQYPLATINRIGKGTVIATTPEWLMEPDSQNKMLNLFSYLLNGIKEELVPVKVYGNVQVLYNKNSRGWVITLINNNGVYKYPGQKEVVRNEEAEPVILEPQFKWAEANEWITGRALSELSLLVPPGKIRIIEIINN